MRCKRLEYNFSGNSIVGVRPREYGVGIAVYVDWKDFIKEINSISNRIMWVYLENIELDFRYVIFSVYGPTNPSDIETKIEF